MQEDIHGIGGFGGTKLSERDWKSAYQLICGNISLQQLATQANININTARFVRQRIMAAPDGIQDNVVLTGHVWIDELYKSHRRTYEKKKRGISSQQIPIFVAVDSSWNILFMKSPSDGKPTRDDAETMIKPHLGSEVTLITTDKNNCSAFIEELGFKQESIKADVESIEYESEMKPVNDLCSHLRERLESHNGIAARYMQRYLNLFWMIFNFAHRGLNTGKITNYLSKLVKSGTRKKRKDLWNETVTSSEHGKKSS